MNQETFKDSGKRDDFGTGAVRDGATGKGRFDLLPFDAIQELARVFEIGCQKYGHNNWAHGIPVYRFIDSAMRHLSKAASGLVDEPHLPMAMWNIACAIQTHRWVQDGTLPERLAYEHGIRLCSDPQDSEGCDAREETRDRP
jgi:hypothetical protein